MSAAPVLTVFKNGEKIAEKPIQGEVLVGRGDGCVIRLDDRAISRQHAIIRADAGGVQIQRKSEFAPLSVNGAECTHAMIKEGDVISIGPYLARISWAEARAEEAKALAAEIQQKAAVPVVEPVGAQAVSTPVGSADTQAKASLEKVAGPPQQGPAQGESVGAVVAEEAPVATAEAVAENLGEAPAATEPPANPFAALDGFSIQAVLDAATTSEGQQPIPELGLTEISGSSSVADMGSTRVVADQDLLPKLQVQPGLANIEEWIMNKDEAIIGRTNDCDIVLKDKKSSRRHTRITRKGTEFFIKDLESVNGTFLNGSKITEAALTGNDVIRIGDTEIRFTLSSAAFEAAKGDLDEAKTMVLKPAEASAPDLGAAPPHVPEEPVSPVAAMEPSPQSSLESAISLPNAAPAASIPEPHLKFGKKTLLERYKELSKEKRLVVVGALLALTYFLMTDFDEPKVQKAKKSNPKVNTAEVKPGEEKKAPGAAFEALTTEQKKFVEAQHEIAFELYKNKEYDKALFEIRKIFQIVPDYLDSRDIERYAAEGKRKLEAMEEERKKKEEEGRIRAKVAQLIEQAQPLMAKKNYSEALPLFSEIVSIDPENPSVAKWRAEVQEYEEAQRIAKDAEEKRQQLAKEAENVFAEGKKLEKKGQLHHAILIYQRVPEIVGTDASLIRKSKIAITRCHRLIQNRVQPLLSAGKDAEATGDIAKAYNLFEKAFHIDPSNRPAMEGMDRMRGILHTKAKALYAEAVVAESYSDLEMAKRKFEECLAASPSGDIYHERALSRLKRYSVLSGRQQQENPQ